MGQGPAGAARTLRRGGPPTPAAERHERGTSGRDLRPLRIRARPPPVARLRRPDRGLRRHPGRGQRVRGVGSLAHQAPLRRRDAGRQPGAVPAAHRHAGRRTRPLRRRRSQSVRLRVQRGRPHAARPPARDPARHAGDPARREPPLHTPGGRRGHGRARPRWRRRGGSTAHDAGRRTRTHGGRPTPPTATRRPGRLGGPTCRGPRGGDGRASPC